MFPWKGVLVLEVSNSIVLKGIMVLFWKGVDGIVDSVGGHHFAILIENIAPGGRWLHRWGAGCVCPITSTLSRTQLLHAPTPALLLARTGPTDSTRWPIASKKKLCAWQGGGDGSE